MISRKKNTDSTKPKQRVATYGDYTPEVPASDIIQALEQSVLGIEKILL